MSHPATELPTWRALAQHAHNLQQRSLRQLFAEGPERSQRFTVEAAGLYLDFSWGAITDEALDLFNQLPVERDAPQLRTAMFGGESSTAVTGARPYILPCGPRRIPWSEPRATMSSTARSPKA